MTFLCSLLLAVFTNISVPFLLSPNISFCIHIFCACCNVLHRVAVWWYHIDCHDFQACCVLVLAPCCLNLFVSLFFVNFFMVVAVCCSVLFLVHIQNNVLCFLLSLYFPLSFYISLCFPFFHIFFDGYHSVLQCVAVCCSVLQCVVSRVYPA